jgi:hypothetical protein
MDAGPGRAGAPRPARLRDASMASARSTVCASNAEISFQP